VILTAITAAALPWFRTRRINWARAGLHEARAAVSNLENTLKPFISSKAYLPERINRPLLAEVIKLVERTVPTIAKTVRQTRNSALKEELESVIHDSNQLRRVLTEHNNRYVQESITGHSKLLVEELQLDAAQREATVRDDERNLVIAAAGSGKTRTLIARIRYLLERGVAPAAILAALRSPFNYATLQKRLPVDNLS